MKIVTVVGARPQFIKAATVSRLIARQPDGHEIIVHTGQHFDENMSDVFFDELQIPRPHYNLGIGGGSHGAMTGRQIESIERVLIDEKPDWVLVYGDTNSTLSAALAASKLNIPIAHVEAGLRSFNRDMPEEINRIVTDHVSDMLFVPTEVAMKNLRREGISEEKIDYVGDVMFDASLFYRSSAKKPESVANVVGDATDFVLATVHRADSTDDYQKLAQILEGLSSANSLVILPLHPRTKSKLESFGLRVPRNILTIPPVSFLEMLWLEANCSLVVTDSGGVQKEAYFFGKPCLTMREETEWVELLDTGWNVLVGTDANRISAAFNGIKSPELEVELYGNGSAAERIVNKLFTC